MEPYNLHSPVRTDVNKQQIITEDQISLIVMKHVKKESQGPFGYSNLKDKCSEICFNSSKELRCYYPELKVIHLEGNWTGPCQRESQNTVHEWLKVVFPDETALYFDPSYVQYLDEDWSWDGCKQAIKYCRLIKSHDPLFTDAFRSRSSEYPY